MVLRQVQWFTMCTSLDDFPKLEHTHCRIGPNTVCHNDDGNDVNDDGNDVNDDYNYNDEDNLITIIIIRALQEKMVLHEQSKQ